MMAHKTQWKLNSSTGVKSSVNSTMQHLHMDVEGDRLGDCWGSLMMMTREQTFRVNNQRREGTLAREQPAAAEGGRAIPKGHPGRRGPLLRGLACERQQKGAGGSTGHTGADRRGRKEGSGVSGAADMAKPAERAPRCAVRPPCTQRTVNVQSTHGQCYSQR